MTNNLLIYGAVFAIVLGYTLYIKAKIKKEGLAFVVINQLKWVNAIVFLSSSLAINYMLMNYLKENDISLWLMIIPAIVIIIIPYKYSSRIFTSLENKYYKNPMMKK